MRAPPISAFRCACSLRITAWPGNVRELQNTVERVLLLGTSDFIQKEDLPQDLTVEKKAMAAAGNGATAKGMEFKIGLIQQALNDTAGDVSAAAVVVGQSEGYIYCLIREGKLKR